jgi:hypothetical protein
MPRIDGIAIDRRLTASRLQPRPIQEGQGQLVVTEGLIETADRGCRPAQACQQGYVGRRVRVEQIKHASTIALGWWLRSTQIN